MKCFFAALEAAGFKGAGTPLSMGEDMRPYVWRGEPKSPRWR